MSNDTWLHRIVRIAVRPLVHTGVTPNHLTTLRLVSGLAAVACFSIGAPRLNTAGGALFLISALLDRADGELARLGDKSSAGGHRYDLVSDAVVTTSAFVGIGVGLVGGVFGGWSIAMGVLCGVSIAALFLMVNRLEALAAGSEAIPSVAGFDADDALLVLPACAWLDWLAPLLAVATVAAPLAALVVFGRWRLLAARARATAR